MGTNLGEDDWLNGKADLQEGQTRRRMRRTIIGSRRKFNKRWALLATAGLLALLLVLAACGASATATPEPEPEEPDTTMETDDDAMDDGDAMVSHLRPKSEWTAEDPATSEEIEAELANYRGQSLNIASWGGAWQRAIRQAAWDPFYEKFGIQIVEDSPLDFAKIRSMVETDNVIWDVVDFGTRDAFLLGPAGILEELDPAIHNGYISGMPEVTITPWSGGGSVLWSYGMAYSLERYPNHEGAPKNWADYWDIEGVPGLRSLHNRPNENIIFAQMALHPELVDTDEGRKSLGALTSAQVDESFAALEEIKDHIIYWWKSYNDCPQLLASGELDICTTGNGRIYNANIERGVEDLYYCFECGHINQTGVYAIPKGSPNKDLAELYLAWSGQPINAIEVSKYITYGPLHKDAVVLASEVLPPEIVANLPTSPIALGAMVIMDEKWLGENLGAGENLVDRWAALLQQE
jgi:putative spermidine/putrescine transport system substrate-binding protein